MTTDKSRRRRVAAGLWEAILRHRWRTLAALALLILAKAAERFVEWSMRPAPARLG